MTAEKKTQGLVGDEYEKTRVCLQGQTFVFQIDNVDYSLRQSTYHPNLWLVVRAPCQTMSKKVRLPHDSDLPDTSVFGEHEHVAAFLVYGPPDLEKSCSHCLPDFLMFGRVATRLLRPSTRR